MTNEIRREQIQAAAVAARTGVTNKLGDIRWFLLLRGLFAISLGLFALFWPDVNLGVLVLAVGVYCIADGAAGLFSALRHPELREQFVHALVVLCIGGILVFWPGTTLRILLGLLGAAALIMGISQVLTARRLPADDRERGAIMRIGVAAMVVGLVLLVWPGSGIAIMSWVIGIAAILIGALLIYLGSRFKHLGTRVEKMGDRA
jgi:uncharacterized membrane protein HdeD (DUF308 family)